MSLFVNSLNFVDPVYCVFWAWKFEPKLVDYTINFQISPNMSITQNFANTLQEKLAVNSYWKDFVVP